MPPNSTPLTDAQAQMMAENTGLIGYMLGNYCRAKGVHEDSALYGHLHSAAIDALARACRGFDPTRGFKFSTYACRAIINTVTQAFARETRRLDHGIGEKQGGSLTPRMQMIASKAPLPGEAAAAREQAGQALAVLDDRERFVIEQRVMDPDKVTLDALGEVLGVTRERVRQIEAKAIRKMREALDPV